MYKLLEARVKAAEKLADPAHVRVAILGIFRIAMQHACVSLAEWIVSALREDQSRISSYTSVEIGHFTQPADGSLVSLLTQLLVAAENVGWKSVARQYWEQVQLSDELRSLTGTNRANLEGVLLAFVRSRNDGAEGHGLPGDYTPSTDVAVARALLRGIASVLPTTAKGSDQLFLPALGGRPSEAMVTMKLSGGNPICYRRLRKTSAGRLQVDAQVQKTLLTRESVVYEVSNVLLDLPRAETPEYAIVEPTWTDDWTPFVYIPDRLASPDVFTGRENEIKTLVDWADDSDSRKCMVWGDGGVGKTTLVVEFLHRLLEGQTTVEWRPQIISYYTAKKTRWGLQGLEHISAQDIGVADVALDIARMLDKPNLDRSWFDKNPREVIQKLATLLVNMKVDRDSHLIILDNTETMAQSDADIQALAAQFNELSKRVGRVILTSRRRENIEAKPVQTENWSDIEGAEFLRKRGNVLKCSSIKQAGEATLRKYSRLLINKPIALEVFVQAASDPGVSLDNAFQRVQRMQRQDLGQFLYDDAWGRLSPEMRRVLLLMSRVSDSHNQYLMQLCCQRTEVTVAATSEAIEESRGIASVTRVEGTLQITFNPEFYNYCMARWEQLDGKQFPTTADIEWVKRRYSEFLVSASAQVRDRNILAFRVPAARAAWKCFTNEKEDQTEQALEYYETAISEDPNNGWLFDRYAHSLMKLKKYDRALKISERAVQLLPADPDVNFTKGMIESRIGKVDASVADLDTAASLGKPKHLCELQKAYAYVYANPINFAEASICIDKAKRSAPKDNFLSRFISEVTRFEKRWLPSDR